MKIPCKVFVQDRTLINSTMKSQKKPVKSTLALCKEDGNFILIHFSTRNKTGTKYKVNDNVRTISTKSVNEGKARIRFKEPAHDFYITGNTNELKSFMRLLKLKISPKDLKTYGLTVQPLEKKDIPVQKLIVSKRSEIPVRGFPKEVIQLYINDISLYSLPKGVLNLKALRILDLSGNCIEYLPIELSKLELIELNLADNHLWKSTIRQWDWISRTLSQNLYILNLSSNKLTYMPRQILRLRFIRELRIDNNKIKSIPHDIQNLRYLESLFVAKNKLTSLPYSIFWMKLDDLNISDNEFHRFTSKCESDSASISVRSLVELAAQIILRAKLPYNSDTISFTLANYLGNQHYCVCGNVCFEQYFTSSHLATSVKKLANWVTFSPENKYQINFEMYYCSSKCKLWSKKLRLLRNFILAQL